MEGRSLKPDLGVPEQKTASLSFCETTPRAFRGWVNQLPMANTGEASRLLYHAIIELNELFANHTQRFQYLELIRPRIQVVCDELSRHYLGLSIALPEKQRKIANLSQALQLHTASGYKLCVMQCLDNGGTAKNKKAIATAIHRAISELAGTILRSYQLYCPSPEQSWLECHRMFRFALSNKLHALLVEDEILNRRRASTIEDAYKRILLLACSRPNQLRQSELKQVYGLSETWTDLVECGPEAEADSLFVINLEQDSPPVYRSLLDQSPGDDSLGFETRNLSAEIAEVLDARTRSKDPGSRPQLQLPPSVSNTLLMHLSEALGILAKRNFNRTSSQGNLEICVGLTATHYYVAGEKTFNQFVIGNDALASGQDKDDNRFVRQSRQREDAWAGAHDAGPSEERIQSADTPINFRNGAGTNPDGVAERNKPRSHYAMLINTSPGGYCVNWKTDVPPSLQTGEVLAVREHSNEPWSIAVIRWIRQIKNQGTKVGIGLLAPSAAPCGVRLIQKTGNSSEYLRGLLLPQNDVVNQAATLITPRLPFQSNSRISMLYAGRKEDGTLARRVSATGSISQFELKLRSSGTLPAHSPPSGPGTSEDEFDSLWPSL
ncbi:GTPase [Marinobacter sp.]|uniref:GTPase n=1 Tax=Marinobacter sp. TaxID=50741 RepID=UPI002B47C222|nr:GTPase [Marinobacter sp.]HKK56261.1 GTPase [Marinobacter sp.]